MDASTWIAAGSVVFAGISAFIAFRTVRQSARLQQDQWRHDELDLRRDVLRRLLAYRYRLTESFVGSKDGEPFIALNEAWVVYAGCPQVTGALIRMHDEIGEEGRLSRNIVAVVRAMADAANISVEHLNDNLIEHPFTPPAIDREL